MEKGKKGFFSVVFSRSAILIFLLLIQIGILFLGFELLRDYMFYAYGAVVALALVLVIYIINKRENPAFMIAWIIPILVIPVFGALFYLFIELQIDTKWVNSRLKRLNIETKELTPQNADVLENLRREDEGMAHLSDYLYRVENLPVYQNTSAKYFPLGEDKFAEMIVQLERAQHFIFMEYFIVERGVMWDTILEILERKVEEGVEVRFMYDGMCSLVLLPYNYPKRMQELGIQCRMFSPIKPALSTIQNNRDHRKILVIDGYLAFTGGINLADEYINQKERFGHWKDTSIMIQGEAVKSFTLLFLKMWNVDKRHSEEDYRKYVDVPQLKIPAPGDGFVIPYGDSPVDKEQVGELVYMDILFTAKKYVHIMTPYLILDQELKVALTYAAKRGVEVIIMMPHIPDKWYAFVLAKTYYDELLDAGVQIYEYTPGFIHAKVFTSDDEKAIVGTINLDFRSMYLHFECAALLYKNAEIANIEADFQETLKKCQKITQEDYKKLNPVIKLIGMVLRLFAPLM